MITTIRTCDRCKKEVEEKDQLWNIAINYQCYPKPAESYLPPKVQWCRPCMEEMGLLGEKFQSTVHNPIPSPAPTLEELVREIVREEIAAC